MRRFAMKALFTAFNLNRTDVADAMAEWWIERLGRLLQVGVAGFRCLEPTDAPGVFWRRIITPLQGNHCAFLAWTPGVPRAALPRGVRSVRVCVEISIELPGSRVKRP